MLAQHCSKRLEPAGRNNRIVVEKNQSRAASERGTTIATTNETDVGVVAQEANALARDARDEIRIAVIVKISGGK